MTFEQSQELLKEADSFLEKVDQMFWNNSTLDNRLAKIRNNAAKRLYRRWVLTFGRKKE